jgi:hypothetical protein
VFGVTWEGQKEYERLLELSSHSGVAACACNPSYSGRHRKNSIQGQPGKSERPYLKKQLGEKTGSVAQVVEGLPSMHEAPSSTPCYLQKIKI